MDTNLTFKELAEKQRKILDKQLPVTFEQALAQVKRLKMQKLDKKKKRLIERIKYLEDEMKLALKQKTSSTSEISVSEYLEKINALRKELLSLL